MSASLRPDETVQKFLISSPTRFVGEFEDDDLLVTHAWPSNRRDFNARLEEGPASRSAYVVCFRTAPYEKRPGVPVPDYSASGPIICACLSVLFGKRFDFHGLIEGSGFFYLPNLSEYFSLADHRLPHNSHAPRNGISIPLVLGEIHRLRPLLMSSDMPAEAIQTFQFASRFYLQALQAFEAEPEVAYLHLITAGEILSNAHSFEDRDLLDAQIVAGLRRVTEELAGGEEIAAAVRSRMFSVRRRFVKTLSCLLTDPFFDGHETDQGWMAMSKESVPRRLAAAYDLRSRYVHTGSNFGAWASSAVRSEVQMGKPVVSDKGFANILHRAPTFMGMERVIRYALLNYIHRAGAPIHECFSSG